MRRVLTLVPLLVVLLVGAAACGGGSGGGSGSQDSSGIQGAAEGDVIGVIVDVKGSAEKVERFTMKTDDGKKQVIYLDPAIDYGLRPGVLQEHEQAGNPIRVATEKRGGKLYATVILNA